MSVFRRYHYPLYIKLDRIQSFNQKNKIYKSSISHCFHVFLCHLGGYYYPEFMNLTLIIIASGENTPLMSRFG
jgi:hypothetical protein